MFRYLLLILLIFIIFLLLLWYRVHSFKNFHRKPLEIKVKIASTPKEIQTGLMGVRHLGKNKGLLFTMNPQIHTFWMKNTIIPLDIIFLIPLSSSPRYAKVIGFKENTKPYSLDPIRINKVSSWVLEVNAGTVNRENIKEGDIIKLTLD